VRTDGTRLLGVAGAPDHPITRGRICGKVARYRDIQEGNRIATPLLRNGPKGSGQFRTISWEEAMQHISTRLQAIMATDGPESVFPYHYGGTMGIVQRAAIERLTYRAGFSRMQRTLCYPIGEAGWRAGVGKVTGPSIEEIASSDLVVLWGINAVSTHLHLMTFVEEARDRGARVVVIDPYRNRTARKADDHFAPRPGSDGALATAVMHVLLREGWVDRAFLATHTDFDPALEAHLASRSPQWASGLTGLAVEEIETLARLYGTHPRSFIRIGVGMSRYANGAVNVHAVTCLPAMTGAWRYPGGGALYGTGDAFTLVEAPARQPGWMSESSRRLDMSLLGHYLLDSLPQPLTPPIRALLVFNANPAVSCPEADRVVAGLRSEELFTVVHEQVMTDTARHADVVLPATTFLEHDDLYKSYGQYTLQYARAALPPYQQARCNHDVINELARRLGYTDPPFLQDHRTMARAVLAASGLPDPDHWPAPWIDYTPTFEAAHFTAGFAHADGRFHFRPGWPQPEMPTFPDHWPVNQIPDATRPLHLLLPPAHEVLNSTFTLSDAVRKRRGPPRLWLHPEDAAARDIAQHDPVHVVSDRVRLTMTAHVTTDVPAGVCLCEANRNADEFPEHLPLNALTRSTPAAPNGGAALHDNRVQVIRASLATYPGNCQPGGPC
jgi:anaerobic selenocysteine-containing dehydrogenase